MLKTVPAPCPDCDCSPVNVLETLDGEIWICPACGYNEVSQTVDLEAQIALLADVAPEVAAEWRKILGL